MKVYYKNVSYKNKEGKEVQTKRYYLCVNFRLVPIRIGYYEGEKYKLANAVNFNTINTIAEPLPEKVK